MPTKLGQNFLTNESIARQIVKSANLSNKDNILEIGPGKGMMTKYLADSDAHVLAIEIDKRLADFLLGVIASPSKGWINSAKQSHILQVGTGLLRRTAPRNDNVQIINDDILKINLPRLIEEYNFQKYKVVANLPYYITSKIIRLLLETKYPPSEMVLMVQKEVGERIVALEGKESILSISVKLYAEPEILFYASKENFDPVPEVDSAVIRITRKKNPPKADAREFFSLVRSGFSAKRKTLANNLSSNLRIPKLDLLETFKKTGLDPTVRAEKLSLEDWMRLYKILFPSLSPLR